MTKRRLRALMTAVVTALAMVCSLAIPAQAASTEPEVRELQIALERIATYYDNDAALLDYARASEDETVDPKVLDDFAVGTIIAGGTVAGGAEDVEALTASAAGLQAQFVFVGATPSNDFGLMACEGRNGYRNFWPTIFLDSCNSAALANLMAAGASAAALAAMFMVETGVGAAVAGYIAGVLALFGSIYNLCNSWGRGIQIIINPVSPVAVCWSQ